MSAGRTLATWLIRLAGLAGFAFLGALSAGMVMLGLQTRDTMRGVYGPYPGLVAAGIGTFVAVVGFAYWFLGAPSWPSALRRLTVCWVVAVPTFLILVVVLNGEPTT